MENRKILIIKDLLETPFLLSDQSSSLQRALDHRKEMKIHFEKIIGEKSDWEKKLKGTTLKRYKNNYILFDDNGILFYGLEFSKFEDVISVKWMENYSTIKGLTSLIFTEILKYDDLTDVIYSGDTHTVDNFKLHQQLKYFYQLHVDVWDERKKMVTIENPYSGIFGNKKQFRFRLAESISKDYAEDINFISIYLNENFELTTENIEHNLEFFTWAFFFDMINFEKEYNN